MVARLVLIVNNFMSLLSAYSNGKGRIRERVAEVERWQEVGGIETIWWDCGNLWKSRKPACKG